MSGADWTTTDERRLRRCGEMKIGIDATCAILGRSRHAVQTKAKRLGVKLSRYSHERWTAQDDADLIRLADVHCDEFGTVHWREMSKAFGRSPASLRARGRRLGI